MGANKSKDGVSENSEYEKYQKLIEQRGIKAVQREIIHDMEKWEEQEINLCVTGYQDVGKSHFINAVRGLDPNNDSEEQQAQCKYAKSAPDFSTREITSYEFPNNSRIHLVDVPGIGSIHLPDLATYIEKAKLDTFDAFLILFDGKISALEFQLTTKIKSMNKPFFLVRTKMDLEEFTEMKKGNPDMSSLEDRIRDYSLKNLTVDDLSAYEIFLISNFEINKWDFEKLLLAVEKKLPSELREAFLFSHQVLTDSIVDRKVEVLKGRLGRESFLFVPSLPVDVFTLGAISARIEKSRVKKNASFYIKQLWLPEKEDCKEFETLKPEFQEKMREFHAIANDGNLEGILERTCRSFPITGRYFYKRLKKTLEETLDDMGELAKDLIKDMQVPTSNSETSENQE